MTETGHLIKEEAVLMSDDKKRNLVSPATIKKIHEITNHKNADNLMWAFKCANLMDADLKKKINKVISECRVCKKFTKRFSRPKATLPKSTEFNQIVTLDLKFFDGVPVLWLIDSCTRFIKGAVLKKIEGHNLVKAIHKNSICNFGFHSIRFWADNGTVSERDAHRGHAGHGHARGHPLDTYLSRRVCN